MALEHDLARMFSRIGSQPVHPARGFAVAARRARVRQALVATSALVLVAAMTGSVYLVRDAIERTKAVGRPSPVVSDAPGPSNDELIVVDGHPTRVFELVPKDSALFPATRVGYNPSVALEQGDPTHRHVFVAAQQRPRYTDVLSSVDIRSGDSRRVGTLPRMPIRDEIKLPEQSVATIVPSSDGSRLYIPQTGIRGGGLRRPFDIATFDVATRKLLPQSVILNRGRNGCGSRDLMALPDPHQLLVLCAFEKQVFKLDIADDGSSAPVRLDLPEQSMWGALSSDGSTLYAVSASLKIYIVDIDTMTLADALQIRNGDGTAGFNSVALAPSGQILYVGAGRTTSSAGVLGYPNNLLSVDITTGDVLARIPLTEAGRDLTVDPSGQRLYATGTGHGNVLVIDTIANRQSTKYHVGGEPTQILVTTNRR